MTEKNMEMMKKLIEEKKNKGLNKGNNLRPEKSTGDSRRGFYKNTKQGGQFDK